MYNAVAGCVTVTVGIAAAGGDKRDWGGEEEGDVSIHESGLDN